METGPKSITTQWAGVQRLVGVRSDVLADELPVAARIVPSTERTMRVDLFDLNEIG